MQPPRNIRSRRTWKSNWNHESHEMIRKAAGFGGLGPCPRQVTSFGLLQAVFRAPLKCDSSISWFFTCPFDGQVMVKKRSTFTGSGHHTLRRTRKAGPQSSDVEDRKSSWNHEPHEMTRKTGGLEGVEPRSGQVMETGHLQYVFRASFSFGSCGSWLLNSPSEGQTMVKKRSTFCGSGHDPRRRAPKSTDKIRQILPNPATVSNS